MRHAGFIALSLILAFTCGLCGAQHITEEQAAEAVRAFESDPSLQFWRIKTYENDEGPEWSHYRVYSLEAGDHDNEIADYWVNAITGEVEGVIYHLYKQHPLQGRHEALPQEQCRRIAEDYARAKYRDFDTMGYRLDKQIPDEGAWVFVWRQVLDYGAVSMNYVKVAVCAADGRIQDYDCERYPTAAPQRPLVDSDQAIGIAKQAAGIIDMTDTAKTELRVDPPGVTYWTVNIQGLNADEFDVCYYVRVESRTGEVLEARRTDYGRPDDEDPDAGPPVTPPAVISPHQARDAVRAFEGNQDLMLICRELDSSTDGPAFMHDWSYEIRDRDNDGRTWDVDAVTGEVTWFMDHSAYPDERTDEPTGRLTAEECREYAERYARAKFRGFDEMNFVPDEPEWDEHGWSFSWWEEVACEPCISSYVSVDVNPEDGRIQSYHANRVPEFTPLEARITAEQAVEIAKNAEGMVRLDNDPDPTLTAWPEAAIWTFELNGRNAQGRVVNCSAWVNAVTGEIIGLYHAFGVSASAYSEEPSDDGDMTNEELMPIRELVAQIPGASVHWLGKDGAKIFCGRDRYTLLPDSDSVEWMGGQIKLSRKTVLEDGRLMVPPDLLEVITAGKS